MSDSKEETKDEAGTLSNELQENSAYALLQRKEVYLRAINQFSLSLIQITSRDEIVWYAAREVVQKMGFVDCVIYLLNTENDMLVQTAAIGEKNPHGEEIANRLEIPVGAGITGHVAKTRKPVIAGDLKKDNRYLADVTEAASEICVPLIYDDILFGVIDCEDGRTNHFTSEHLEVLTIVAAMLSAKLGQVEIADRLRQAQKMEAVGQLTGGIAHDFNNLLAVIMGNLEIAQDAAVLGNPVDRSLDLTMQGARKAADLIKRLQSFSSKQSFELRSSNVCELVASLSILLERSLGEKYHLVLNTSDFRCIARFDPSQFENAILNLVLNARDAMPDGGDVMVTVAPTVFDGRRDQDQQISAVRITVSDSGTGMSHKVVEQATEPFFTTKNSGAGSGLGLSMVFGFVNQFGGEMKIDSVPDVGTQVTLVLPTCAADPAADIDEPSQPKQTPESLRPKRVLVVEDNPDVMDVTLAYLETLGHKTLSAVDGVSALEILKSDKVIDLVLSDIVLPGGIDGIDIVEKAQEIRPELKLLLMSGFPGKSDDDSYIGRVDVPILRKPFRLTELATALKERFED